jgi:hypothetical protein
VPYFVALLPLLAFVGVVGAIVALLRGRRRAALGFAIVGVVAVAVAIGLYYSAAG